MTDTPDGMLERALEPYPPPQAGHPLADTTEASEDLLRRLRGFPGVTLPGENVDPDETLLETVAEALAASYLETTFATAGALIHELERRGFDLVRRGAPRGLPVIHDGNVPRGVAIVVSSPPPGPSPYALAENAARIGYARGLEDGKRLR